MSYEPRPDQWTRQVIAEGTLPSPSPDFLPGGAGAESLRAVTPIVEIEGPLAQVVSDEFVEEVRRLRVRLYSPRQAPFMMMLPDAAMATIQAIGVEDQMVEVDADAGQVSLVLQGVPPEGVVVTIQTFDRQPVSIDLVDWSFGFDGVTGDLQARPASLLRRPRWMTDSVLVRRNFWF